MALLSSSTFHHLQWASGPMASAYSTPISSLSVKPIVGNTGRVCFSFTSKFRSPVTVKASADTSGTGDAALEDEKAAVSVENLPLESKLQEKADAKLRMKLAKKIRLRRKRLVKKRQLRKKGRWPPSKMKKLKNV
uniref:50S ribosomal protein 5, chloroplastic n=1 Tax=Kalanchoe fedtschenkoi TaxID=63787 RepID=A0A7N0VF50_KALFE